MSFVRVETVQKNRQNRIRITKSNGITASFSVSPSVKKNKINSNSNASLLSEPNSLSNALRPPFGNSTGRDVFSVKAFSRSVGKAAFDSGGEDGGGTGGETPTGGASAAVRRR